MTLLAQGHCYAVYVGVLCKYTEKARLGGGVHACMSGDYFVTPGEVEGQAPLGIERTEVRSVAKHCTMQRTAPTPKRQRVIRSLVSTALRSPNPAASPLGQL